MRGDEIAAMEQLHRRALGLKSQIAILAVGCFAAVSLFVLGQKSGKWSLIVFVFLWAVVLVVVTIISASAKHNDGMPLHVLRGRILRYAAGSAIAAAVYAFGTLIGAPQCLFDERSFQDLVKDSLFRASFSFCVTYTLLLLASKAYGVEVSAKIKRVLKKTRERRLPQKKTAIIVCCNLAIALAFAAWSRFFGGCSLRVSFCFALAALIPFSYIVMCIVKKKADPAGLFLAFALPWALFIALCTPSITGLSWDDQIHYANAQALSYIINAPEPSVEANLYGPLVDNPAVHNPQVYIEGWDHLPISDLRYYEWCMNYLYPTSGMHLLHPGVGSFLGLYNYVGYIPSAMGLWIGRLFHLPIITVFVMGRCCNALFYVTVSYISVRIIPCKKLVLTLIALLPSTIFLAANYSYDPWIICMLYLACSLAVKYMTERKLTIDRGKWLPLVCVAFASIGPKAVYFPMLAFLFFIPRKQFTSAEESILFRLSVTAAIVLAACSFAVPFLISGGEGYSDTRINHDTDSSAQLGFILGHPFDYLLTLFDFVFNDYLILSSFNALSYSFSYIGDIGGVGFLNGFTLILVVIAACIDSDRRSLRISKLSYGMATIVACLLSTMLIATALYISFTPVGADAIQGVQARYITPMALPVFLFVLNPKVLNVSSRWFGNVLLTALISIPLVLSCMQFIWLFIVG